MRNIQRFLVRLEVPGDAKALLNLDPTYNVGLRKGGESDNNTRPKRRIRRRAGWSSQPTAPAKHIPRRRGEEEKT